MAADDQRQSGTAGEVPDPSTWRTGDEPPTGRQRAYLETLARDAGERVPADLDPDQLNKAEASEAIDELRERTDRG